VQKQTQGKNVFPRGGENHPAIRVFARGMNICSKCEFGVRKGGQIATVL